MLEVITNPIVVSVVVMTVLCLIKVNVYLSIIAAGIVCGALVAVYGAIQNRAMPDVNVSLIDRYYASASQTPALVLGQLARMSNYHIGKIDSYWWEEELTGLRDQVACAIGNDIPTVLCPEQQAYFALGYYQMCARINKDWLAHKAVIAEKKAD